MAIGADRFAVADAGFEESPGDDVVRIGAGDDERTEKIALAAFIDAEVRGEAFGVVEVLVAEAGFAEDFVISVPRGMADKVTAQLISKQPLIAPIAAGSAVGTLKLAVGGQPWGEYPVVAQSEVPLAGFFGRLWDDIRLFFQ